MSTIMPVTTIVGLARGSTIRVTSFTGPAPSIMAASSISRGMVSKYPFIFHNANTAIVPVYTITSPSLLLISPRGLKSLYSAVMDSSAGKA